MLGLRTTRSFKSIAEDWERLYEITPEVSPFLTRDAMRICLKYFYPYYIVKRCIPVFLLFYEQDSIKAIAPMLKYPNGKMELFGFVNGFNESGMLFETADILPDCLRLIKEKYKEVVFLKIDERSPLSSFAPQNKHVISNAEIHFGNDFDEYFKLLSKSVRQNIRTAYNRLTSDGYSLEIKVYEGGNELPISDIIDLYCQRHEDKYAVKTGFLKKLFLKTQSFATQLYLHLPDAKTFVLYINGRMAAFMSGISGNGRLIIPRLSIDNVYKRYSPGMLLVIEAIKYLISSSDVRVLDLSQGQEQYKYNLGAVEHLSFGFKL